MDQRAGFVERFAVDRVDVVYFANVFIDQHIFLSIRMLLHCVSGDVALYLRGIDISETFAGVFSTKVNKMQVTYDLMLIRIEHNLKFLFC